MLMLMHMFMMAVMHVFPAIRGTHSAIAVIVGVVLMAGGIVGVRQGLLPFGRLREKLSAVRAGEDRRVAGEYPSEVQPLIDEMNALLEDRETAVKRAVATAGDLAHGLKTPLSLLAQVADQAGAEGHAELAESISRQVERMSRQVDYHLARARAAASGAAGAPPLPSGGLRQCFGAHCFDALCGPWTGNFMWHRVRASRAGAKGGSRRDTRKPAGQRLQMGKIEDRVGRVPNGRHAPAET
jgi:hypothetical protein